jgi:hypothetical protein
MNLDSEVATSPSLAIGNEAEDRSLDLETGETVNDKHAEMDRDLAPAPFDAIASTGEMAKSEFRKAGSAISAAEKTRRQVRGSVPPAGGDMALRRKPAVPAPAVPEAAVEEAPVIAATAPSPVPPAQPGMELPAEPSLEMPESAKERPTDAPAFLEQADGAVAGERHLFGADQSPAKKVNESLEDVSSQHREASRAAKKTQAVIDAQVGTKKRKELHAQMDDYVGGRSVGTAEGLPAEAESPLAEAIARDRRQVVSGAAGPATAKRDTTQPATPSAGYGGGFGGGVKPRIADSESPLGVPEGGYLRQRINAREPQSPIVLRHYAKDPIGDLGWYRAARQHHDATIYWNPLSIANDDGQLRFSVALPPHKATYRLFIDGHAQGRIGAMETKLFARQSQEASQPEDPRGASRDE